MGVVTDDAISQLEQICMVLVSLLLLLPSMGPKWPHSQALVGVGVEERKPGTLCLCMHQIPLVTCILLYQTKITENFCLPAERPHFRVTLLVRHLPVVFKSETIYL